MKDWISIMTLYAIELMGDAGEIPGSHTLAFNGIKL